VENLLMELPDAPFYRRWSVILAGVVGLAAITALLGWRGLQQVASPATTVSTVARTVTSPPTTAPPTSFGSTSKPAGVLWEEEGAEVGRSPEFRAPSTWRIRWSFDCGNFARYGGGNFKITGDGAFERIDIQSFDTEGSGTKTFARGGLGRLLVHSVCRRWTVTVLAG
jgi:hypothetical protein